jgi:hypothetical protein
LGINGLSLKSKQLMDTIPAVEQENADGKQMGAAATDDTAVDA